MVYITSEALIVGCWVGYYSAPRTINMNLGKKKCYEYITYLY